MTIHNISTSPTAYLAISQLAYQPTTTIVTEATFGVADGVYSNQWHHSQLPLPAVPHLVALVGSKHHLDTIAVPIPSPALIPLPAVRVINLFTHPVSVGTSETSWWGAIAPRQATEYRPVRAFDYTLTVASLDAGPLGQVSAKVTAHQSFTAILLPTPLGVQCLMMHDGMDTDSASLPSSSNHSSVADVVRLRFLNALPAMAEIDVLLDDQHIAPQLAPGLHSPYAPLNPRPHHVSVYGRTAPGTAASLLCESYVRPTSNFTTLAVWPEPNGTISARLLLEDYNRSAVPENQTLIRFLSLCASCPPLGLTIGSRSIIPAVKAAAPSDYHQGPAGHGIACAVTSFGEVFVCQDPLILMPRHAYTIVVMGHPSDSGAQQLQLVAMTDGLPSESVVGLTWGTLLMLVMLFVGVGGAFCTVLECVTQQKKKPKRLPLHSWHSYGTDMAPRERDPIVRFKNTPTVFSPMTLSVTPTSTLGLFHSGWTPVTPNPFLSATSTAREPGQP